MCVCMYVCSGVGCETFGFGVFGLFWIVEGRGGEGCGRLEEESIFYGYVCICI